MPVPIVRDVWALDRLGNRVAKSSILETRKFLQKRSGFPGDSISGLPADKADDVDVWYIILDFTFDDYS